MSALGEIVEEATADDGGFHPVKIRRTRGSRLPRPGPPAAWCRAIRPAGSPPCARCRRCSPAGPGRRAAGGAVPRAGSFGEPPRPRPRELERPLAVVDVGWPHDRHGAVDRARVPLPWRRGRAGPAPARARGCSAPRRSRRAKAASSSRPRARSRPSATSTAAAGCPFRTRRRPRSARAKLRRSSARSAVRNAAFTVRGSVEPFDEPALDRHARHEAEHLGVLARDHAERRAVHIDPDGASAARIRGEGGDPTRHRPHSRRQHPRPSRPGSRAPCPRLRS